MQNRVIIVGAGGHGKVIADIIEKSGDIVVGFLDDNVEMGKEVFGYKILGKINDFYKYQDYFFIIAIGNNKIREIIINKFNNIKYYTAIHPSSIIAKDVIIGEGTAIMAGTIINASAKIGKHSIINTGAIVEHDNIIHDYCHVSPNAVLAGTVVINKYTHIGVGVTIKNNLTICENVIIGAGATVVKDIKEEGTYFGVPAKKINKE